MDDRGRLSDADKRATLGCANRYPGKAVETFTLITIQAYDSIIEKPPRVRRASLAVG